MQLLLPVAVGTLPAAILLSHHKVLTILMVCAHVRCVSAICLPSLRLVLTLVLAVTVANESHKSNI